MLVGAEIVGYNGHRFEYYGNPSAAPEQQPNSSVQDIIEAGYKIGFIGVKDAHDGKPGKGGLTGIYADSLTRESLFAALKARRFFATTGARMVIDFMINGHVMGETFVTDNPPVINVNVKGTNIISAIEIVKNNKVLKTFTANDTTENVVLTDTAFTRSSCYYVRAIQIDGSISWANPIWVFPTNNNMPDSFSFIYPIWKNGLMSTLMERTNVFSWERARDVDFGKMVSYQISWTDDLNDSNKIRYSDTIWGTSWVFDDLLKNNTQYYLRLTAEDERGGKQLSSPDWIKVYTNYWDQLSSATSFGFIGVSPNPSDDYLKINVFSKLANIVYVGIYDISGRKIWSDRLDFKVKGTLTICWKTSIMGEKHPSGIYFVNLHDGTKSVTNKICIIR